MNYRISEMIKEIENGVSLSLIIPKAIKLCESYGDYEFRKNLENELNGYKDPNDIPHYRNLTCNINGIDSYGLKIVLSFDNNEFEKILKNYKIGYPLFQIECIKNEKKGILYQDVDIEVENFINQFTKERIKYVRVMHSDQFKMIYEQVKNNVYTWAINHAEESKKEEVKVETTNRTEKMGDFFGTNTTISNSQFFFSSTIDNMNISYNQFSKEEYLKILEEIKNQINLLKISNEDKEDFDTQVKIIEKQIQTKEPSFIKKSLIRLADFALDIGASCLSAFILSKLNV